MFTALLTSFVLVSTLLVFLGYSTSVAVGQQETTTAIESKLLAGKRIVINPGHGLYENDNGRGECGDQPINREDKKWCYQRKPYIDTITGEIYREDEGTVKIARYLVKLLKAAGADVYTTRDVDSKEYLAARHYPSVSKYKTCDHSNKDNDNNRYRDLNIRPCYADKIDAGVMVSIHTNGSNTIHRGTETFYLGQFQDENMYKVNVQCLKDLKTLSRTSLYSLTKIPKRSEENEKLAQLIHNKVVAFAKNYTNDNWKDRGIKLECQEKDNKGDFIAPGDNHPETMPAALIEVAFHDNPVDLGYLNNPVFQEGVAGAIFVGILEYCTQQEKNCEPSSPIIPETSSPGNENPVPSTPCSPNLPGIILYSEPNYNEKGRCTHLTASHANLAQLAVGDNTVSSIWINGNYQVRLFEHTNSGGRYTEVNHSEPNLDITSLGNQYSSIEITNLDKVSNCGNPTRSGVYFYEEIDFNSRRGCHYATGDIADFGNIKAIGNNGLSSVKIVGDWEVILYTSQNFRPTEGYKLSSSKANLDRESVIGHNVSSARVRPKRKPVDLPAELPYVTNINYQGQKNAGVYRCQSGSRVYVDRDLVFTTFSNSGYSGLPCIVIANDDKYSGAESLLEFDLTQPARLYLYVDRRLDQTPGWMAGFFGRNGDQVKTSGDTTRFDVYSCDSQPGHIRLGGLYHGGGRGANANYVVAFAPIAGADKVCSPQPGPEPCPAPLLLRPQNASITTKRTLTFTWGAVNCPTQADVPLNYLLQIASAPNGGELIQQQVVSTTQQTLIFTPTLDNRDLYWSVQVANPASSAAWATYRHFRVEANDPPTLTLNQANTYTIAANGQAIWDNDPIWSFSGVAGDDHRVAAVEANCFGYTCNQLHLPANGTTAWSWVSTVITPNLLGRHDLYFQSIDEQGVRSDDSNRQHVELWVDQQSPATGLVLNNGANPARWPRWFTEPVVVRLVASDGGSGRGSNYARSGVQAIRYCLDGGCGVETGDQLYLTLGNDGVHTLLYQAIDDVGNLEIQRSRAISIDLTAPTLPVNVRVENGIVNNNQWQNAVSAPLFRWDAASDAASGVAGYQFYFGLDPNGIAYNYVAASADRQWQPTATGVRTGEYHLRARTHDHAGNWSEWGTLFVLRYDATPPPPPATVRHAHPGVSNGVRQKLTTAADFSWSPPTDPGAGFAGVNVYWGTDPNGVDESRFITDNRFQSATPLCAANQSCFGYLRLRTRDYAGNWGVWTTLFTLHYDGAGAGDQPGQARSPNYRLVNDNFPSAVGQWTMAGGYRIHSTVGQALISTQLTSPGYRVVSGYEAATPRQVACLLPQLTLVGDQGAAATRTTAVTLSLCAPDAVQMQVSNEPSFAGATWQPYQTSLTWTLQPSGQNSQLVVVYVRLQGVDGTIRGPFSAEILYDPAAPLVAAFNIGDSLPAAFPLQGAAQAAAVRAEANLPIVGIEPLILYASLRVDDKISTTIRLNETAQLATAPWRPFTPETAYLPTAGDGIKTLWFQLRDAAGNESAVQQVSFIHDNTPPQGGILFDMPVVGPNMDQVQVYFSAEDNLTGVAEMRVSADPFFAGTIWRPYTSSLQLPAYLPAAGELTLFAQYRDNANNLSDVYSDTYRVDISPPTVAVVVEPGETLNRTIIVMASDDLSEMTMLRISNDPLMQTGVQTVPFIDQMLWSFDDRRVAWVQVVDKMGNVSEAVPAYAGDVFAEPPPPSQSTFLPLIYR